MCLDAYNDASDRFNTDGCEHVRRSASARYGLPNDIAVLELPEDESGSARTPSNFAVLPYYMPAATIDAETSGRKTAELLHAEGV